MSEATLPGEYLVLSRGKWDQALSKHEIQKAIDAFYAWYDRNVEAGRMKPGRRLTTEGKVVSKGTVTDGPFAESKEAIGGYFLLKVNTLDDAVAIAKECPGLAYGIRVEVRLVAGECPVAVEARGEAQLARA